MRPPINAAGRLVLLRGWLLCLPIDVASAPMMESRNRQLDLVALGLLGVSLFATASLVTYDPFDPPSSLAWPVRTDVQNACGVAGAWTAHLLLSWTGALAWFVVGSGVVLALRLFARRSLTQPAVRAAGWFVTLVALCTLASSACASWTPGPEIGAGGYLGACGSAALESHFALAGAWIIGLSTLAAGLLLWTDYALLRAAAVTNAASGAGVARVGRFALRRSGPGAGAEGASPATAGADSIAVAAAAEDDAEEDESDDAEYEYEYEYEEDDAEGEEGDDAEYEYEYEEEDEEGAEEDDDAAWEEDPQEATPLKVRTPAARAEGAAEPPPVAATAANAAETVAAATAPEEPADPSALRIKKPRQKHAADAERAEVIHQLDAAESRSAEGFDYELPPLDLLQEPSDVSYEEHEKEVRRKARILEKTFRNFGFNVKVVEIETGPVIAQYEVQLEAGLRLSKITSLADDLAIALRVPSVRIVAPIPGKNTVGIEVPNENRQLVLLREVIEETNGAARRMKIPIYLGKDVAGNPMTVDLAALPHLLIAGRTGTGKSVCLNSIIVSILMSRGPDEVRMLMIDPKMVELSGYKKLPHLMHPVVTDMRKAEAILAWAVDKMEERYAMLARAGVRHVSVYNQLSEDELRERVQPESDEEWQQIPRNLPFIVIVADEMADLMMTAGKEVEQHIIRLAQKSRAVGIHLILATQKPTVDVITGLIKSNLPARIAFQVASRTDSRVVLDEMGADKLLGNGDMLFLSPGTSTLLRGQGTYLSDDEIARVTDFVATDQPQFARELIELKTKEEQDADEKGGGFTKRDDLYEAAVDVVVRERRGSVSLLQRCLGIGYGRAARLIDYMAEDGIVGEYNGSQAREVTITVEQWEAMTRGETPAQGPPPSTPATAATATVALDSASARAKRSNRIVPDVDEPSDLEDDFGSAQGSISAPATVRPAGSPQRGSALHAQLAAGGVALLEAPADDELEADDELDADYDAEAEVYEEPGADHGQLQDELGHEYEDEGLEEDEEDEENEEGEKDEDLEELEELESDEDELEDEEEDEFEDEDEDELEDEGDELEDEGDEEEDQEEGELRNLEQDELDVEELDDEEEAAEGEADEEEAEYEYVYEYEDEDEEAEEDDDAEGGESEDPEDGDAEDAEYEYEYEYEEDEEGEPEDDQEQYEDAPEDDDRHAEDAAERSAPADAPPPGHDPSADRPRRPSRRQGDHAA